MQPTHEELHYVEEFGLFWEQMGLPRMTGRILGWLLICDPPEQTMTDLTEVLQASKSSISTGTRMLIQFGFIERISLPGERKDYYRLLPHLWTRVLAAKQGQLTDFLQLAQRGLALLSETDAQRRERLEEMHDLYAFMEVEYPKLLERWRFERSQRKPTV
ncbi:MarR family transcriptional regulator [bacterium]|nr:MarR family transcriptional regulator [bacterium]